MSEHDLIMLYSGGADSMLMLKFALEFGRKPYCVLIDYGQKHINELKYAQTQLKNENIDFQIVKISDLNVSSGLTGDLKTSYDGVHAMNVPGRNTMFISIAYSIAESMGIKEIWYGPDFSDRLNLFPDCYQDYVVAMNKVLEVAPSYPITLRAPLLGWTKEMVLEYLEKKYEIKQGYIHSGYDDPKGN
jgi:7-cyano-7-deazaguanine synthase